MFYNPRTHHDKISVNVSCLDDFDLKKEAPKIVTFDGRNCEAAPDLSLTPSQNISKNISNSQFSFEDQ